MPVRPFRAVFMVAAGVLAAAGAGLVADVAPGADAANAEAAQQAAPNTAASARPPRIESAILIIFRIDSNPCVWCLDGAVGDQKRPTQ